MPGTARWETQVAMYARAAADATLQGLLGGSVMSPKVFDGPPTNQTHPYVCFGLVSDERADTLGRTGRLVRVPLVVYSRYLGNQEVTGIAARLEALFDRYALSVSGWDVSSCLYQRSTPGVIDEGLTRADTIEFELGMSEA